MVTKNQQDNLELLSFVIMRNRPGFRRWEDRVPSRGVVWGMCRTTLCSPFRDMCARHTSTPQILSHLILKVGGSSDGQKKSKLSEGEGLAPQLGTEEVSSSLILKSVLFTALRYGLRTCACLTLTPKVQEIPFQSRVGERVTGCFPRLLPRVELSSIITAMSDTGEYYVTGSC